MKSFSNPLLAIFFTIVVISIGAGILFLTTTDLSYADPDSKTKSWINEGCTSESEICYSATVTCSKTEPFLSGDCKEARENLGANINKKARESCEAIAPSGEDCRRLN